MLIYPIRELVFLRWHKRMLSMIQERQEKKVALVVDTSSNDVQTTLINNIVKLFEQVKPDTLLVQADYRIPEYYPGKVGYH